MLGRTFPSEDHWHFWKVHEVTCSNWHFTVREVVVEVGISKSSFHEILVVNLGMQQVAAKFMPCLLIDEQKQRCLKLIQVLFDCANDDKNVLKKHHYRWRDMGLQLWCQIKTQSSVLSWRDVTSARGHEKSQQPNLWRQKRCMVLHDNAPAHSSLLICFIEKVWEFCEQPLCM